MPEPWRDLGPIGGAPLLLTPEETRALAAGISELVMACRRDDPDVPAPEGARRVFVQYQVMPRPGAGSHD